MAKDILFSETPRYDEFDPEDVELERRRMATYSRESLRVGLAVDRIIVQYTQFKDTLQGLDRIFQLARDSTMPQGGVLIGHPGAGRRSVCRFFQESLPRSDLFAPGFGAIRIRLGPPATIGQVVQRLLRGLEYPFYRGNEAQLQMRGSIVIDQLIAKGTRLLMVTGGEQLLLPGNSNKTGEAYRYNRNVVEYLMEVQDETNIGIVLAGDERVDTLREAARELKSRLTVRMELTPFKPDRIWAGFIKGFVKLSPFDLGLRPDDPVQMRRLNTESKGNARDFKRLATEVALIASHEGRKAATDSDWSRAQVAIRGFAHKTTPVLGSPVENARDVAANS